MPDTIPLIGGELPKMVVQTTHGVRTLPDDYRGRRLVIFIHQRTLHLYVQQSFVAFAKRHEDFKKLDTELLGLSVDNAFSHIKWVEWIKEKLNVETPFPIIADPRGEVALRLGMLHAQSATQTQLG